MFVKPSDDPSRAVVRDHMTGLQIPAEGLQVSDHDPYWLRLLSDGDVVKADVTPKPVEPEPAHEPERDA